MAATIQYRTAEVTRKSLLAESDELLDEVEALRLRDALDAPLRLREAIRALQIRLGRRNPPVAPATVDAVHDLVFAVQQRIMSANPNHPRPRGHAGRPPGQPIVTLVREDRKWKMLALPAPGPGGEDRDWMDLVDSTVERALDRWCYAQWHAVRAAREHVRPLAARAVAEAAWMNYWVLMQDAERIKERFAHARPAADTASTRRPSPAHPKR